MEPLLELRHVGYAYHSKNGETYALSDLSFQVQSGEFIAIVGPSGCGKSTLLSLISGLLRAESGAILLNGKEEETFQKNTGYMLQKDHLFEWRSIYRNVILGLEIQGRLDEKSKERVENMLADYGLARFRDARPSQLSGGMRQRAALIRTMMMHPSLLLLDEPFSALDYQTRLQVCSDIWSIIRESKKTAILVTHDLAEAISTGSRVLVLSRRPTAVQTEISFDADFCGLSPIERRKDTRFNQYFQVLWEVFSHE